MYRDMCYKYADYVIRKINKNGKLQNYPLSNKRLQKILFVATAIYARKTGQKLFDEDFYAWECGPVMPTIYSSYSKFQKGYMMPLSLNQEKISFAKKRALKKALKYTKRISTIKLIENSHVINSPWRQAWRKAETNKTTERISFNSIKIYYSNNRNFQKLISN